MPKYDELPRGESGRPHAWGLFGEDDSFGRLNLITPEVATEVCPPDWSEAARPFGFLHRVLIGRLGFANGEPWDLEELSGECALDGSYQFLLVSAPLQVPGGLGSPSNALASK